MADMDTPSQQPALSPPGTENELYPVAQGSEQHLAACSLVLSAMGIDHLKSKTALLVDAEHRDSAAWHLQAYREENRNWPPPPSWQQEHKHIAPPPTLLMIGSLFLFFQITGPWQGKSLWFQVGAIDSQAVFEQGQWWRLFTALSLHADEMHLLGNCLIGGGMVHLLCTTIGYGSGWLLLLLTGGLGNLLNIALRDTSHHSVGFSTAVFATIGMFSGLQMKKGKFFSWRILMPLGAGIGLLAFLGTEGERTDLGAHFMGFVCGIIAGLLTRMTGFSEAADNRSLQRILFLAALGLFFSCWWLAFRTTSAPLF
jgi:membrane associated rhomboid family serine protease